MNKILFAILLLAALSGCGKPAESSTRVGRDFEVERLFTHDGCTVYRFNDYYTRYFTRCEGVSVPSSVSWTESCGKNCKRPVEVSGGAQ